MAGLLLAGDVYLDRLDANGNRTGYMDPVNVKKFAITNPDPDKKERISNMRDTLGQALDVVTLPKPPEIEIGIDDQPAQILAMSLLGDVLPYSQTSGSVTDEPVTLIPDRWVALAYRNIDASGFVLAKASAPNTPLVEGTDYAVNRVAGLVKALSGGAITESTACLIDYGYGAQTGSKITGSTSPIIRCAAFLDGVNMADGKRYAVEVDEARLSPTGDMDLLSGEFIVTSLRGTLRTLPGNSEPYRLIAIG